MNNTGHMWHFNWPMLIVALVLLLIYYAMHKGFSGKAGYYISGVILLLMVTISPIDPIGHHYLFSAHMIQHIVILLVVPPLLLSGLDGEILSQYRFPAWLRTVGTFLFHPVIAWVIGIGAMWFWHIPSVFLTMKMHSSVHFLHLLSLLIAGIIFIWPVYSPVHWRKLSSPLLSVLYLFMACVGCTILGIFLTFSTDLYYIHAFIYESQGFLPGSLQLSPASDQQIAGLIMWVPACVIYIVNSMVILGKWLKNPEPDFNK